jgi:hypothetical protein
MTNEAIKLKVKQRLNKLASNDYDNILDWHIVEAFNKGAVSWCRRQLQGTNMSKTGDESSKRRIDDLQPLLKNIPVVVNNKQEYYQVNKLPTDYFEWKRISANATHGCCNEPRRLVIYLAEEANLDTLLRDANRRPSFEWAETFCTISGNQIKIHTDGKFDVSDVKLMYYSQPIRIQIKGTSNPYTADISLLEVECQFKDDVVEVLVDECVKILSGDVESINVQQTSDKSVESNN